jgi:hypothetical protein
VTSKDGPGHVHYRGSCSCIFRVFGLAVQNPPAESLDRGAATCNAKKLNVGWGNATGDLPARISHSLVAEDSKDLLAALGHGFLGCTSAPIPWQLNMTNRKWQRLGNFLVDLLTIKSSWRGLHVKHGECSGNRRYGLLVDLSLLKRQIDLT